MEIRKTHPQLYLAIWGISITSILLGVSGFISPKHSYALSAPFIIIGVLKLIGVHFWQYKVVQVLTALNLVNCAFYLFAFVPAFLLTWDKPETRQAFAFLPLWFWYTTSHFIILREDPAGRLPVITHKEEG